MNLCFGFHGCLDAVIYNWDRDLALKHFLELFVDDVVDNRLRNCQVHEHHITLAKQAHTRFEDRSAAP